MHFVVLKESFLKALGIVGRSIPTRAQLPILSNILIKATDKELILSGTDLELGIVFTLPVKVEEKGEITVPGKILSEFVGSVHGEKLEFIQEATQLKIISGKTKATFATSNPEDFPPFPEVTVFDRRLPYSVIKTAIPRMVFAASTDEARPILTGVRIVATGDTFSLTSTDGYRLSIEKITIPKFSEDFIGIIPAGTLTEVSRIATEMKVNEVGFTILKDKNQVVFSLPQVRIYSRLIDGEFPTIEKIIPQGFKTKVILKKDDFLQAVKTTSLFARGSANVVKVVVGKNTITLSANTPQVGGDEEVLEANVQGEETEIAFNYRFLLDLLNNFPQGDVVFEISGNLSPGLFKSSESASTFLHIIMPVRVQG